MSTSEGEAKEEALRELLNSFATDGEPVLPKDASVSKLAEKLDELLASKGGLLGVHASVARDDQGRVSLGSSQDDVPADR
ncbi:hypothetical protein FRC08_010180 [Ceratobasidium sp. 394]|nr:hypothetical protein FRC08_010180 [Ceratobasidium sp. 394]